tara:strand:+ start:28 stop:522 length:495 start_codon:yes stop_codon:yes gene_type:complete
MMTRDKFLEKWGYAKEDYFERMCKAKQELEPVIPQYCIVFEDPADLDAPVTVTTPAPAWLAMALAGGYLPPIESYLRDRAVEKAWIKANPDKDFNWKDAGGATHPHAVPIAAMTEKKSMEYLLMMAVPRHIWEDTSNRTRYRITKRSMIPNNNRVHRNAWRLAA